MTTNPWNRDQVMALIDAYREETSLYAIRSPNYHNKHVRAEALKRVCSAVRPMRSNISEKECVTKFHNLRSMFNVENTKIRDSTKSGVGTGNIYKPNLWYFESLKYLEEHVMPRKSRTSSITIPLNGSVQQDKDSSDGSGYNLEDNFTVFLEGDDDFDGEITQFSSCISSQHSPPTVSPITPSRPPPTPSSSSQQKRQKTQRGEGSYTGTLESIAESLRQPIAIPTVNPVSCPVDSCMSFLGSLLKQINSEELKLDVMNTLVQTVINAKTLDLEKSKQSRV